MSGQILRVALTLVALGAAAACADGTIAPSPSPTVLRLDLQTAHADDGAIVIAVHGPDVSSMAPASPGYLSYTRSSAPQETRVIVVGDLKAGPLLTLRIAPGHQLSDYSATIQQVATRTDVLRGDLSGYRVTVTVP